MTVTDLISDLIRRFPKHAREIAAWTGSYDRRLAGLDGADLARCYEHTLDSWPHGWPPKPGDFAIPGAAAAVDRSQDIARTRAVASQARALVDQALGWHQNALDALAAEFGDLAMVKGRFLFVIDRLARQAASAASRENRVPAAIALQPHHWDEIRSRIETFSRLPDNGIANFARRILDRAKSA